MNEIVYFGCGDQNVQRLVRRYAESSGRAYRFIEQSGDWWTAASALKHADMAVIWNGRQGNGFAAREVCEKHGIPCAFIEWGMLPQSSTYFVDPSGFCQRSVLCGPLGWVTDDDMARLHAKRAELQRRYPLDPKGHVLAVLQIENDTTVLFSSKFRTMDEFIEELEAMYPDQKVIVRPHPKSPARRFSRFEVTREPKDFLEAARTASLVVGLTSTCLTEAGVLGVPVLALGDCPLRVQPRRTHDRLFAGALALTIDRKDGDLRPILDRFGVGLPAPARPPESLDYAALYERLWGSGYNRTPDHGAGTVIPWLLENAEFESALEVGCGLGESVEKLREAGKKAVGIDIAPTAVREARAKGRKVREGSALSLPFPDLSFDVVYSADVMEHLLPADLDRAIAEQARVARRYVVHRIPERPALEPRWNHMAGFNLHVALLPREQWIERFEAAGLYPTHIDPKKHIMAFEKRPNAK